MTIDDQKVIQNQIDELQKLMQHQDVWYLNDIARILEFYNKKLGSVRFFKDLVMNSVKARKIVPVEMPSSLREKSDFGFLRSHLCKWAETKDFFMPEILDPTREQKVPNESLKVESKPYKPKKIHAQAKKTFEAIILVLKEILITTEDCEWKKKFMDRFFSTFNKKLTEEQSCLLEIYFLSEILTTTVTDMSDAYATFKTKGDLIDYMVEGYGMKYPNFSKSNIEKKFAQSKIFMKNIFIAAHDLSQQEELQIDQISQE